MKNIVLPPPVHICINSERALKKHKLLPDYFVGLGLRAYLLLCLLLPLGLTAAGPDKHDAFCDRAAFSAAASEFAELLPIQHDYGCGDALEYRLLGDPSQ